MNNPEHAAPVPFRLTRRAALGAVVVLLAPTAGAQECKNACGCSGVKLVTYRTVGAFANPLIGASAAVRLAHLGAEHAHRARLGWSAKERVCHMMSDALDTATLLLKGVIKRDVSLRSRAGAIRTDLARLRAAHFGPKATPNYRRLVAELGKVSLSLHALGAKADQRFATKIKIAVLQAIFHQDGLVVIIGEKGVTGARGLFGTDGMLDTDAVLGAGGLADQVVKETKALRQLASAAAQLSAARAEALASLTASAQTVSAKLADVSQCTGLLRDGLAKL